MPRLLIPLIIIAVGFLIYGVIDVIRTPGRDMRYINKASWLLVVILVPIAGTVLWIMWGTKGKGGKPAPRPTGQRAPDDDEAFLRSLRIRREQEAKEAELRAKEAELRRLENDLRKNQDGEPEDPKNS